MNFIILAVLLAGSGIAAKEARRSRASQSQRVQYKQSDGLNVDLSLFSPDPLWRSRTSKVSRLTEQAPKAPQLAHEERFNYQPFQSVPGYIKQLINDMQGSQQPYVNPHAFFYQNYIGVGPNILPAERAGNSQGIQYQDQDKKAVPSNRNYQTIIPLDQAKRSPVHHHHHQMPTPIQTLLNYQAQIPYNVLANNIAFEAKKPFIPQPLPTDTKHTGHYPNKIYYIKADGQILDQLPMGVAGGQVKYTP